MGLFVVIIGLGCKVSKIYTLDVVSKDLEIHRLTSNSFVHITYLETNQFGRVPCNGLIYFDDSEAMVFDTPTTDSLSLVLIKWIENSLKCKVKGVVINHFHEDCLGGLQAFHSKGIPSYASARTIELATNEALSIPTKGFQDSLCMVIGNKEVINQYFGEGHTVDNIVSYFPFDKVLFGGCLIKSNGASKGYLNDANVIQWPITVSKIKAKFSSLKHVVPGHGNTGNSDLLSYTINLFSERK